MILRTYRDQIDSEISRLLTGIEYESGRKTNSFKIRSYERLLINLLVKRIFASELEKQLKPLDLDQHVKTRKPVFNTDAIKVDLEKNIGVHLDSVANKENLGHFFIKDLKSRLIRETITNVAVRTYKAIGAGLLTKIITNGVTSAALKTAVLSIGSEVFVSAGTASILTILTLPLQAYRLPPETVWTDILKKHPELIINPEWMKYAGSQDSPWFSHSYAILRRTQHMEKALQAFLNKEENEFRSSVISIHKIPNEFKKEETGRYNRHEDYRAAVDGTYVHRRIIIQDHLPFWAEKRK